MTKTTAVTTATPPTEPPDWQQQYQAAIRDPHELCRRLNLPDWAAAAATRAADRFPLVVPESYLRRIEPGNVHDPLLRQVLPLDEELADVSGFGLDPVGDGPARKRPGLIHKYSGRVLLIACSQCAIHCRYCFRRDYPYQAEPKSRDDWRPAIEFIAEDRSIHEVILSGGDPLSLSDARLLWLADRIAEIPHVRRMRIHSRLPIVIPDRVTNELASWFQESNVASYFVVHANHANELNDEVLNALAKLKQAGVVLLNQAVLLRGVNDSFEALSHLCQRLTDGGILPYYLNQLDQVRGAAHFEVPIEVGIQLVQQLRSRLPGYAVPTFVREIPGEPNKHVLA